MQDIQINTDRNYSASARTKEDAPSVRHSLHPSLDATLRAAIAVQLGRPADLS